MMVVVKAALYISHVCGFCTDNGPHKSVFYLLIYLLNKVKGTNGILVTGATGHHMPYGITQCYLLPDTSEHPNPNPQAGSRFIHPREMEG